MNERNGHMPFKVGPWDLAFRHVDDRLAAYISGECSERECVAVERHLDACAACRAALDETQRIRALLAPLAAQTTPRSVADAVLARLAASTGEGSAGLHVAESSTAEVSPHSTDCPVSPAGDVSLPVACPEPSSSWRRREGVPERDTAAMERHTSTSTRTPAQRGHAQGNRIASGAPESRGRLRSFATVAAVVLIALGAGIFGLMSHRTQGLGGQRLAPVTTPAPYDCSQVPATPVATYTPQNKLIKTVVTATGADNNHVPIGPTSCFLMTKPNGSQNASAVVSVIVYVRGVPKGEHHTVSVHWYIQDVDVGLTPNADTEQQIAADANVLFTLAYPQPGLGTARIFVDLQDNETSDPTTDPHLAATIYFAIMPPNAGTPTVPTGTSSAQNVNADLPANSTLADISMDSPTDGWAVGTVNNAPNGGGGSKNALLVHYDGHRWTTSPDSTSFAGGMLISVSMASADDGWAVGSMEDASLPIRGLLLHYTGGHWREVDISNTGFAGGGAVHIVSADEGWLYTPVGEKSSPDHKTLVIHYHNGAWRLLSSLPGGNLVSMLSASDGWAANQETDAILRYQSGAWTRVATAGGQPLALAMVSPSEGWIAGFDANNQSTFAMRYDGQSWSLAALPAAAHAEGDRISVAAPGDIWIFGQSNSTQAAKAVAWHYRAGQWTHIDLNFQDFPTGASMASPASGWVTGNAANNTAALLHYDQGTWSGVFYGN